MPPIQVFSNSPINASKPSGATPQTSQQAQQNNQPPSTTSEQVSTYPAPQPGAAPSLPQPTSSNNITAYQPTPTRAIGGDGSSGSPPPPQPGAVPVPPGTSHLPPPPKSGETFLSQQPSITTMPPQMSYSLPGTNAPPHHLGSSTSTAPLQAQGYPGGPPQPTTLMEGGMGGSSYGQQPPSTYQQNTGSYQQRSYDNDGGYDSQEEGVWGTAKKWAYAAGDSLAKAENEVWKRINKD